MPNSLAGCVAMMVVVGLAGCGGAGDSGGTDTAAADAEPGALSRSAVRDEGPIEPAGEGCRHEPPGLTPAISTGWRTTPINRGKSAEGWWHNEIGSSRVVNLSTARDSTAPRSPSEVLQMKFPQGSPGGDAPFWFGHPLPKNTGTIYMCLSFRADPNWTHGGNAGTKFAFIRTRYADGPGKHNHFWGLAGGDWKPDELRPMFGTQWANADLARAYFADNGQSAHGGEWRQIELLWIAEEPAGAQNGTGRLWLDGKLVVDVTDAQFFLDGQTPRWTSVEVVPTYGGGVKPVPRDLFWWMDHTYVSVR